MEIEEPMIFEPERIEDAVELKAINDFLEHGCDRNCKLFNGTQCSGAFSQHHIGLIRSQCASMERMELSNVLFGHVMATTLNPEKVEKQGHHCLK
jgi:hypothetical protein